MSQPQVPTKPTVTTRSQLKNRKTQDTDPVDEDITTIIHNQKNKRSKTSEVSASDADDWGMQESEIPDHVITDFNKLPDDPSVASTASNADTLISPVPLNKESIEDSIHAPKPPKTNG